MSTSVAPLEQQPSRRLTTSSDLAAAAAPSRQIPAGFYYPSFPRVFQCSVCLAPWRRPVTFHPCLHTVCRRCTAEDFSQCPSCGTPCTHFTQPSEEAVAEAKAIPLACEGCAWQGTVDQAAKHTCQGRQHDIAVALLRKDPHSAKAWFMLGASLKPGAPPAEIQGKQYSKVDCYLRSLELDGHNAHAWGNLAAILEPHATIVFHQQTVNKRQCAVRCLNLNPRLPIPWFNLGNLMLRGETEDINGTPVYKDTCYVKAVQLDPHMHAAWHNLGLCLDRGMVIDINDREYDAAMCFITAILMKQDFAESWSKLAIVGPHSRTFLGKRWTSKECAAKALLLNRHLSEPWLTLNRLMTKPDETVEVGSRVYTKQQVEKRAGKAMLVAPQRPSANPPPRRSASSSSRGSHGSRDSTSRPHTPNEGSGTCLVM